MELVENAKCPNCLTDISEYSESCPHCKVEFYNCSNCNALILGNDTFCRSCGSKLEEEKPDKPANAVLSAKPVYEYKSLEVITNVLLILLASEILFSLINIYGVAIDISFLKENMNSGGILYDDELSFQNILITFSQFFSAIIFLTGVIIYFVWVRRAYRNLNTLQSKPNEYSSAWAIGSYFVPIVNLFRPYTIMQEIWFGSQPEYKLEDESDYEFQDRINSTTFLKIWWATFLIDGFANNLFFRMSWKADTAQKLLTSYWIDIISYVTSIFISWMIIHLIWTIKNWQLEKVSHKPTKPCQHCGNQVEFDALFCTNCGKYLKAN